MRTSKAIARALTNKAKDEWSFLILIVDVHHRRPEIMPQADVDLQTARWFAWDRAARFARGEIKEL